MTTHGFGDAIFQFDFRIVYLTLKNLGFDFLEVKIPIISSSTVLFEKINFEELKIINEKDSVLIKFYLDHPKLLTGKCLRIFKFDIKSNLMIKSKGKMDSLFRLMNKNIENKFYETYKTFEKNKK